MKRQLLLTVMLVLIAQVALAQKTYLVAVGIGDYPGYSSDLRLPTKDAATIANLCKKNNSANYRLLLDERATASSIKSTMSSFFSNAGKNDIVILYFSGHGCPDGFVAYDRIVTYDEIRQILSKCKCKNKMVFADSCFSGELRATGNTAHGGSSKKQNVMFFLSSRSNETSLELPNYKNGVFTAFLERALRGGADYDYNRTITASELFKFVSKGVKDATGDRQHPVMWGNFDNNMPVMKW